MTIIRLLTIDDLPEVEEVIRSRNRVVGNAFAFDADKLIEEFYSHPYFYESENGREIFGLFDDNGKLDAMAVLVYINDQLSVRADDPAQYEKSVYVKMTWTRKRPNRIKTPDGHQDSVYMDLLIAMLKRFETKKIWTHWVCVANEYINTGDNQKYLDSGRDKYVRRHFQIPAGQMAKDPHAQFINKYILITPRTIDMEARVVSLKTEFRDANGDLIPESTTPQSLIKELNEDITPQ